MANLPKQVREMSGHRRRRLPFLEHESTKGLGVEEDECELGVEEDECENRIQVVFNDTFSIDVAPC